MRRFALVWALLPCLAAAETGDRADGAAIKAALEGRVLLYANGARQEFRASGRTLYNAGEDSWGYWAVRDDQYCSLWPPSDLWACYAIELLDAGVRFIGASGDVTDGTYTE